MHTQASVKKNNPMYLDTSLSSGSYSAKWLQIATISASTLKFSTLWGLFLVTPRIGDASFLTFAYFTCKFFFDKQMPLLGAVFYLRYLILTASSLVSLLHKYFKLLAKAKFGHWKFWDIQTPHI